MAGNDPVDQDAIAAQWEASLDSEDPTEAAEAAAANELSGTMALQWAAMVEDGSRDFGGGKNGGERVLSQEEIDNLLGFNVGEVSRDAHSGIRAIIDSAMVSYERLPMLEIVFDRLVRLMTTSLRNFTSDNVEVSLDRITSGRFGGYLNTTPRPARDPHRGSALYDDRDQSDQAHDRGGAGRRRAGVPAAVAGQVQHRSAGDQSALRRDLAAGQCGDPGAAAHRHGRPRRHHR